MPRDALRNCLNILGQDWSTLPASYLKANVRLRALASAVFFCFFFLSRRALKAECSLLLFFCSRQHAV